MVWKSAKVVWDRADGGGDMWLSGLGVVENGLELIARGRSAVVERFGTDLKEEEYHGRVVWN